MRYFSVDCLSAKFIMGLKFYVLLIACLAWNGIAVGLMGLDKRRARKGQWRISEQIFFVTALFFGAAGIWAGMYLFRHKTRHRAFVWGIPMLVGFNVMVLYMVFS